MELKPCPFCGGKADPAGWISGTGGPSIPRCVDCGASSGSLEEWNTRTGVITLHTGDVMTVFVKVASNVAPDLTMPIALQIGEDGGLAPPAKLTGEELIKSGLRPDGDLILDEPYVTVYRGNSYATLDGKFDADTLVAIVDHMDAAEVDALSHLAKTPSVEDL